MSTLVPIPFSLAALTARAAEHTSCIAVPTDLYKVQSIVSSSASLNTSLPASKFPNKVHFLSFWFLSHRKSPTLIASCVSTIAWLLFTSSSSISRVMGVYEPTLFTWQPGRTQLPANRGVDAFVAVTMTWAPSTAQRTLSSSESSTVCMSEKSPSLRNLARSLFARSFERLTITSLITLARRQIALMWSSPCNPAPKTTNVSPASSSGLLPSRTNLVASAEPAAVRAAVRYVEETTASTSPVSALFNAVVAVTVGKPSVGLLPRIDTNFIPITSSSSSLLAGK
mmetsp:Transcript_20198/g.46333  ORF Transcript_20198/g.46333 Transcript_20198/m.46333 type:complete len:283 (-) Transcript_20198:450-1298(-)